MNENTDAILTIVRQIPAGKVATYAQVARLAGLPRNARQVGAVLRNLPIDSNVPWFRVVNSQGKISDRGDEQATRIQAEALIEENVEIDHRDRISLDRFRWMPNEKT